MAAGVEDENPLAADDSPASVTALLGPESLCIPLRECVCLCRGRFRLGACPEIAGAGSPSDLNRGGMP